ncbi:hypothetical protein AC578_2352 [Pseudocercospora eumusae]|uniref:7-dehydrocholesterol reductase n=1 Tax=Pseudocercospora eumusae TaxID=321146 RepID=A0A139HXG0_9PEZI|nr:hypothetical protein AC578_2352 [Pseudocercospora eumusae]
MQAPTTVVMEKILTSVAPEATTVAVTWGRKTKARWESSIGAFVLCTCCPILVILNFLALEQYAGSLLDTFKAALDQGPVLFILRNLPKPSVAATAGYAGWILLQAALYTFLPGTVCHGQKTPGGNLLSYTTNGLTAWFATHILFLTGAVLGRLDAAVIARHWEGLLVAANVYGFLVGFIVQLKGYWAPSHPEDVKLSGSWIYDYWIGVELNPRLGKHLDLKFFHNGRVGMGAWTLINLSWAAYQYQQLGYVTDSMLIVLILHATYVVDFYVNEDWYLRTIDISHDHFGFMLSWGDSTFLPSFYTLQAQYLARYPTHLTRLQAAAILGVGFLGYAMFRSANFQRDHVRAKKGDARIWGRKAEFIRTKYRTSDNVEHESLLLTSGWWGVARHANYLADLIQCFAFCATCGFTHILPWSYFFFMCILLCHRARRDERRCRAKYGKQWEEYCGLVPYTIIPGIF